MVAKMRRTAPGVQGREIAALRRFFAARPGGGDTHL
jgi:hypothetical protein